MKNKDALTRFIFESAPVRGTIIQLDEAWQTLLQRKNYPEIVQTQLGEFLAANALLASTLKLNGALVMQIQGDGPINFMVMECTSEKHLRGMAQFKEPVEGTLLADLFGSGQLVITVDNSKSNERYQSIVTLEGKKISHALESYLQQSEQLDTIIVLATNKAHACGLLVQRLPGNAFENEDKDDWNRISQLAATIKADELTSLEPEEILYRLFNEDDVRILDIDSYQFQCSCSKERVSNMLISLGKAEIDSIIEEQGSIDIDCEFCSQHYTFDSVDAEELFATDIHHTAPKTQH
ncbi:MAG: Hsp33 family molecular chaperone HslO [Gammaproteobacteria bacterium]|nr:Hsp33 family molecular chaperone HslO [Gammaproteobacteria bacterium]